MGRNKSEWLIRDRLFDCDPTAPPLATREGGDILYYSEFFSAFSEFLVFFWILIITPESIFLNLQSIFLNVQQNWVRTFLVLTSIVLNFPEYFPYVLEILNLGRVFPEFWVFFRISKIRQDPALLHRTAPHCTALHLYLHRHSPPERGETYSIFLNFWVFFFLQNFEYFSEFL